MYERLEQVLQIQKICSRELKQAQANCEQYSSDMTLLTEKISENWRDTNSFLRDYDCFLTNITTIMDATRKFNLHIRLYNIKLSEMHKEFLKTIQTTPQNSSEYTEELKKSPINFFPAEEYNLNSEAEDFTYPTINLSELYKVNDVINGTVTYIKSLKELQFYIFDYHSEYRLAVVELSKSLELRQHNGMPTTLEVFGCVLDNQIFRAVRGTKTFFDEEMNEEIFPCYILDTGEILPLKADNIVYKLTNAQKNIPALALPCQLMNKNPFTNKITLEDKLKDLEYNKCFLKIIAIENNALHVEIVDNMLTIEDGAENEHTENLTSTINTGKTLQLTAEQMEIIYEEPLNTSNAMKAVMGYDPQDDKRICRFYNPSTGGCFKGVNCKLEHTLRQPDGWTKDILPTSSIIDNKHPITIFPAGSIINITPTYVGQLDRFFAQINECNKVSFPLVWNDADVPSWRILQKPPHMFELVLSRYTDGLWYRANIMSHDDEYQVFEVQYVDYGNIQMVDLRNLASIDVSMAQLPFQAVLCRFENVNEKSSVSLEERKNCIEILRDMIVNKSMDVKVVSHYEDLFISFVDKKSYPIPDVLIEMGYLELNEKILV